MGEVPLYGGKESFSTLDDSYVPSAH